MPPLAGTVASLLPLSCSTTALPGESPGNRATHAERPRARRAIDHNVAHAATRTGSTQHALTAAGISPFLPLTTTHV